ncbi:hypothetical protein JXA05_01360 [Candidatus Peregrinibacteria bacterium]|nr:hypothetical protein [Candidatus Peregrinibacteria bacterium]
MTLEKSSLPPVPESSEPEVTREHRIVPPPEAGFDSPFQLMLNTLNEMGISPAEWLNAQRALDKERNRLANEKRQRITAMVGVVGKSAHSSQV